MKRIASYFFQGLIYIAPLGITIYIIYFLFTLVDGFVQKYIQHIIKADIPGLGIIIVIILITLLGFAGQTILARPFKLLVNRVVSRAPLIKLIYSSLRDLFSAFVGKEKKFDQPVVFTLNTVSDIQKLGFITKNDLSALDIKDKVAVYCPHSYNFSGELFIVPKELIRPVDVPSSEAMKLIVSGGVTGL
jgi:uncharacterized membrane protein